MGSGWGCPLAMGSLFNRKGGCMDSDPQEGHPNSREVEHLLCNSHPVAYGWSWDFRSGKRVTYDIRKGFLEVYYTDKGNPMEGYPKEMDEEGLVQLLRAVLQLEGTMSDKYQDEMRKLFEALSSAGQDGLLAVDNSRGKEVDLEGAREQARKLNEVLMLLEPRLPEILPKKKRDEIANLTVMKAASKSVNSDKPAEKAEPAASPIPKPRIRYAKPYS